MYLLRWYILLCRSVILVHLFLLAIQSIVDLNVILLILSFLTIRFIRSGCTSKYFVSFVLSEAVYASMTNWHLYCWRAFEAVVTLLCVSTSGVCHLSCWGFSSNDFSQLMFWIRQSFWTWAKDWFHERPNMMSWRILLKFALSWHYSWRVWTKCFFLHHWLQPSLSLCGESFLF